MTALLRVALPRAVLISFAMGVLSLPVAAEDLATPNFAAPAVKKPKPAKSTSAGLAAKPATVGKERRPGELEGFESGVVAPVKSKPRKPADAISERVVPDGGLPLPGGGRGVDDAPPVGFDSKGNVGGMFRF